MAERRVRVYQAVNHTTGEALVSFSADHPRHLGAALRLFPPRRLKHWRPHHKIRLRMVSRFVKRELAVELARARAASRALSKFRPIVLA